MPHSLPFPALGAEYHVPTEQQVQDAINRHENDQDGGNAVMLNIKNDIGDMSQIVTREGWTYTFHGNDHPPEAVDAAVFL